MHEASLLRSLMREVERAAAREGAARVVEVTVRLGALAHLSPDHLRTHFEEAAHGGPAAGAALRVIASEDVADPRAQDVILESVVVETAP